MKNDDKGKEEIDVVETKEEEDDNSGSWHEQGESAETENEEDQGSEELDLGLSSVTSNKEGLARIYSQEKNNFSQFSSKNKRQTI